MGTIYFSYKTVNRQTSLQVITLIINGIERYALIDQDKHIFGFERSEKPYMSFRSISEAIDASIRPLKLNSKYKGFPATHLSYNTYVLDIPEEALSRNTGFSDPMRPVENLTQIAIDFCSKSYSRGFGL